MFKQYEKKFTTYAKPNDTIATSTNNHLLSNKTILKIDERPQNRRDSFNNFLYNFF